MEITYHSLSGSNFNFLVFFLNPHNIAVGGEETETETRENRENENELKKNKEKSA